MRLQKVILQVNGHNYWILRMTIFLAGFKVFDKLKLHENDKRNLILLFGYTVYLNIKVFPLPKHYWRARKKLIYFDYLWSARLVFGSWTCCANQIPKINFDLIAHSFNRFMRLLKWKMTTKLLHIIFREHLKAACNKIGQIYHCCHTIKIVVVLFGRRKNKHQWTIGCGDVLYWLRKS